ncbi:MAG: hypothetical protein IAF58_20805 [Leptolyngbya sp.]|nr:hypothetical protein [Candidatus Melainabacteria bacterium]
MTNLSNEISDSPVAKKSVENPFDTSNIFSTGNQSFRRQGLESEGDKKVLELFPPANEVFACGGSNYDGKLTSKREGDPSVSGFSREELEARGKTLIESFKRSDDPDSAVSEKLVGLLKQLFPGKDKIVIAPEVGSPELTINFAAKQGAQDLFKSRSDGGGRLLVTLPNDKQALIPMFDLYRALKYGVKPQTTLRGCGLETLS